MLKRLQILSLTMTFLFVSASAFAQSVKISGTIVDEAGLPVIGVAVLQQGTTNGAATDFDGKYSLSVPKEATIVVSCIGYQNQTFVIGDRITYDLILKEDTQLLEETLVIGYGVQNYRK